MVIASIKEDLKKLLDKNAAIMSIMALFFTLMSYYLTDTSMESQVISNMRIEGFLLLYTMFFTELSKTSLVNDKISKKIEFILANGLDKEELVRKYFVSITIASCIILLPTLVVILIKMQITILLEANLILSSLLTGSIVIMAILYTINMNKINGIQIKLLLFMMVIIGLSFLAYKFTNMIELYLIVKTLILVIIYEFLALKTNEERIVVSYY